MHVGRGLYYSSYKSPRTLVWSIGVVILILMMAIAFLGYNCSPKWSNLNNNGHLCDKSNIKLQIKDRSASVHSLSSGGTTIMNNILLRTIHKGVRHNSTLTPINNENSKILTEFLKIKNLKPVYCYENLHLDSTRKKVQMETENLSGIYLIFNKVTLDYYIGSASTNRFYARFSNHLLYFRGSKIVKLAVKKYKLPQFAFIILELFPELVTKENNKNLLDLEDFYLKSLLPNYNILTEAGSSFGYKHTEISRLKIKSQYSPERREKIGNLNKGKNLSFETIVKIRTKALTRTKENFKYSEQSILNINMKKNSKPIILYNLDNTVYGQFSSIVEAAKDINCSEKTIRRVLITEKKLLKKRWIIKYLTLI